VSRRRPAFWLRALVCAGCGGFFFLVYGLCNAYGADHPNPGRWYADWELAIPLVPWLILPYWSIDLLFVLAFLSCREPKELANLTARVGLAVLLAAASFLLWPLELGFTRSTDHGIWSPFFALLYRFDQPHNLFPSLHVAFAVLFRWHFARQLRGGWHWFMHGWFLVITASTVLVHQHHLVDVAGGALLGLLCCYAIPYEGLPSLAVQRDRRTWRLCGRYGLGSAACLGLAGWLGGWAWLLLWPGLSLALVALAYAGPGSAIAAPQLAGPGVPARIVLFPWLEAIGWSRRWWWRRPLPPVQLGDRLWLGRIPDIRSWEGTVIDCSSEHRRRRPAAGDYRRIPIWDLTIPPPESLRAALDAVTSATGERLVCCGLGLGRSALVVAATLIVEEGCSAEEAVERLRRARPTVVFSATALDTLRRLADGTRARPRHSDRRHTAPHPGRESPASIATRCPECP